MGGVRVSQSYNPTEAARDKLKTAMSAVLEGFSGGKLAFLPLNPKGLEQPIASASQLPTKYTKIQKYARFTNGHKDFMSPVTGKQARKFSAILWVSTDKDLEEGLKECIIDIAVEGICFEKKTHPSVH